MNASFTITLDRPVRRVYSSHGSNLDELIGCHPAAETAIIRTDDLTLVLGHRDHPLLRRIQDHVALNQLIEACSLIYGEALRLYKLPNHSDYDAKTRYWSQLNSYDAMALAKWPAWYGAGPSFSDMPSPGLKLVLTPVATGD